VRMGQHEVVLHGACSGCSPARAGSGSA
jgi:Fe-S cluster biogenesis protein NfuA